MRWWGSLGLLAAIRVAIPLAAYADAGSGLPGMPAKPVRPGMPKVRANPPIMPFEQFD